MTGLIVHEWIEKQGGAEKVLDNMVKTFPDSDIACLWNDAPERFSQNSVLESWMSKTPLRKKKPLALPLMSATWRNWRVEVEYDWVLVSSYVFGHHARFPSAAGIPKKFVYVHTPARYIWAPELDPRGNSMAARAISPMLRQMDKTAAKDDSSLAANSQFVRERILRSWGRDARVIYPPVDVAYIQSVSDWSEHLSADEQGLLGSLPPVFLLGASRFVEYKGLDLVISAGELVDLPVVIAGSGPLEKYLLDRASTATIPVTVLRSPSNNLLYALYQRALAYLFPPIEDFGIMPIEAMAAGCPVLARSIGGTAETVSDGVSGFQLERFEGAELSSAIARVSTISRDEVGDSATKFDSSRFRASLSDWLTDAAVTTSRDGPQQSASMS